MPATTVRKAPKPTPRPRTSGDATQIKDRVAPQRMNGEAPQPMTAEEYLALPERINGITYELVQGTLVVRDPGVSSNHSCIQGTFCEYFNQWMKKFGYGGRSGVNMDCFLTENLDTFRIPDVAVFLRPFHEEDEFHYRVRGAPDIAIEVLSPSNDEKEMRQKTAEYFKAGALRVWIVDPEARTVAIRKADGSSVLFEDKDILEDPEILPDFALEVQKIFDPPVPKKFLYPRRRHP